VRGDGDGWVVCDLGHRHWGRHGAAGLLLAAPGRIVLQHRAPRTHEGDTWGLPGGARDSHESVVATALREAGEEAAIDPAAVEPIGLSKVDHGGWSYTTVVARPLAIVHPVAANWESEDVRWCDLDEVDRLPLHPGFAQSWPGLRPAIRPIRIVVDMANVVGSRPDGWWHDREGANARLRRRITALAEHGVDAARLPAGTASGSLATVFPAWVLVVEGVARTLADAAGSQVYVSTVAASGSGDDEIVARVGDPAQLSTVVVTSDRELRARVAAAICVGPQWLLSLLDDGDSDDTGTSSGDGSGSDGGSGSGSDSDSGSGSGSDAASPGELDG
jgi:8-oxo-dGTP diphosphatase